MAQRLKFLPAMQETWVWSLGWEDPLEKEIATHSSILAWRIPWMEEPGGLQSMGSQRVGHDSKANTALLLSLVFMNNCIWTWWILNSIWFFWSDSRVPLLRTQAELKSLLWEFVPQFSDIHVDTWSNISMYYVILQFLCVCVLVAQSCLTLPPHRL